MNIKTNDRGTSIIEITVVIVIAILVIGIFAMNRDSQMDIVYREEARVILNHIAEKEKIFYATNFAYYEVDTPTHSVENLGISLLRNQYFGEFSVEIDTKTPYTEFNPKVTIELQGKDKMQGRTVKGVYNFEEDTLTIED